LYIPLLCHIKGNLKEYCCHKVDKRITEIIKRRNKQRMARAASLARKEAAGDFSHLKNKKGEFTQQPLPQPTLPNIALDDDLNDAASVRSREPPSTYAGDHYYATDNKSGVVDYANIPAYNQPYSHLQDPNSTYAHYNPSATDLVPDYPDEYGSTAHLSDTVGVPYAQHSNPGYQSTRYQTNDAYDVYSGYVDHNAAPYGASYSQNMYADQPSLPPIRRSPSPTGYDNPAVYGGYSTGQQQFHAV